MLEWAWVGTAGERLNNFPGSAGETQGCFFLHKLFQADSTNQVFLLLGSSLLQGTFLAFLLRPAGWVCRKHPLYPVQTPAWDEASLHHYLGKSSQAALCCQGMKIWPLSCKQSRHTLWRSPHLCLFFLTVPLCPSHTRMNKLVKEVTGGLGTAWSWVLPSAATEVVTSCTTWIWLTKDACDPPEHRIDEKKALLPPASKLHFSLRSWYGWPSFLIYV